MKGPAMTSNLDAATAAIGAVRHSAPVDAVDETLVAGLLSLAAAVDEAPQNSALWREYREFIDRVREIGGGGVDDDDAAFLAAVRTPVGDTQKP